MAMHDYQTSQPAPQNALESLLQPPIPVLRRLAALDAAREARIAQLHRAASLRWESRGRLARQQLIDGSLDIHGYRREVADAQAAREVAERDVPPAVDRTALQERAYAVAQEAVHAFYDRANIGLEGAYQAWTPSTVEQAEGGNDAS